MALALVQSTKKVVTGVNNTTLAYGSNLTSGNLLCNTQTHYSNPSEVITTPTDTLGHAYAGMAAEQSIVFSADATKLRSFYKENCSAGADTVTFDIANTTTGDLTCVIAEFSGIATTAPLGTTNTGAGTNTAVSGGAVTPGANGALIWGGMTFDGATTTITENTGGGFALVQENETGSSNMPIGTEWLEQAVAASIAATWTLGASRQYIAHTACFTAAGGGGGAAPMRRRRMLLMGMN